MKMFALTVAAVAGLLCTATSADAQFRYRNSGVYANPSYTYRSNSVYSYPSYSGYSTYSTPLYTGPVGVGSYTPLGGTTIITPASFSSPVYNSSFYNPGYSSPVYGSSFTSPVYNGYNRGIYIAPAGGNMRGRGWRY